MVFFSVDEKYLISLIDTTRLTEYIMHYLVKIGTELILNTRKNIRKLCVIGLNSY